MATFPQQLLSMRLTGDVNPILDGGGGSGIFSLPLPPRKKLCYLEACTDFTPHII